MGYEIWDMGYEIIDIGYAVFSYEQLMLHLKLYF